ncbi:MAG: hydantoinase B/oxoprolinase family protein [Alphaproteobacteria bacterium]|jgi:N-methylhydantoinase B|nr:hydantoinase B/oxoprolinase family protein [Alphaproteobacteria bacterium]MDP6818565.1 hydantoinase B/oxoprolinase family protein [Alphaproteobacteria bacterium]
MAAKEIDPVTLEITRGKLLAAVDEMGIVIARTSMSPVIYEVLDFACGILDTKAQLIVQTNGITLFTGTFSFQLQAILKKFAGDIQPGDVYMTNDPFEGGTHTCDVALIRPLFDGGTLRAFAIAVAHWSEVGGSVAGSIAPNATEIYQEGLRFPAIRVCRDDELIPDVVALIRENVRLPTMCLGDLNAELAAVRIAEVRFREIERKYGIETVDATFDYILETSEQLSRDAVAAMPDGSYRAEDLIDGDGITDEQIPVCVEVRIAGERMTFDFTGTSGQRPGPINCAYGALHSAVKTVFKSLVDPQGASNEGWFRPVEIICPEGTVFTAQKPAPTGWYYEGSAHASELVWKALAGVAPEHFSAGSYMSLCGAYIYGKDPESGEIFVHIEPAVGGWGATSRRDGTAALIATTDGDTYNYSVELFEAKFPLYVRQYALNIDEGVGEGRYRGGFGAVREFEILADEAFTYASFGRTSEPPWGLEGGAVGSCNFMEIESAGETRRVARIPYHALQPGDRVRVVTGGGGGYGDAYLRPAQEVLEDVRNDYITPDIARDKYGVALTADGAVDDAATQSLRAGR